MVAANKSERGRERYAREKRAVLVGLSNRNVPGCACCTEAREWALTIDHIHGGGSEHRRRVGPRSTFQIVSKEHRDGETWEQLRERYQVLCAICNLGRRIAADGVCPHKHEAPTNRGTGGCMIYINFELVKSYVKVFAATVLGMFLADGADVFAVSWTDLRTWLSAGVAAVLPLVITALDPNDPRWGRSK
jgi:hypothetical protein